MHLNNCKMNMYTIYNNNSINLTSYEKAKEHSNIYASEFRFHSSLLLWPGSGPSKFA